MPTKPFSSAQAICPAVISETEPEIAAYLLRSGVRIHEVPISYRARSREEGKKLTSLNGLRVLRTLVRCRVD